jgi:hypothetical protein
MGLFVKAVLLGAWPLHDSANFWLAGRHVLEGSAVYGSNPDGYLIFPYAPPVAVLSALLALPGWLALNVYCAVLLVAEILAFRYVAGSWLAAGLLCWLPIVPREFMTGNVDFLMAAAILAGVRGRGWPVAFGLAKYSSGIVLLGASRRQWTEAILTSLAFVTITLPWLHLWPEWFALIRTVPPGTEDLWPMAVRLPVSLGLIALRRPWALALAAGLLTPSFHFHTPVMLLPGLRLLVESYSWNVGVRTMTARSRALVLASRRRFVSRESGPITLSDGDGARAHT